MAPRTVKITLRPKSDNLDNLIKFESELLSEIDITSLVQLTRPVRYIFGIVPCARKGGKSWRTGKAWIVHLAKKHGFEIDFE